MKDLIQLRKLIDQVTKDYDNYASSASDLRKQYLNLANLYSQTGGNDTRIKNFTDGVINKSQDDVSRAMTQKDFILDIVKNHISEKEKSLLDNSFNAWKYKHNRTWFITNHKNHPNEEVFDDGCLNFVKDRLNVFETYHVPALEIGAGDGYWYEHLAGFDPVYLCDINWALLDQIIPKYPDVFWEKNRIKFVKGTGYDLPDVEKNSIGFVFSWNTFNFLPVEIISKYLDAMHYVMQQGAYACISYTNAEREDVHNLVGNEVWAYNTESRMVDMLNRRGFRPLAAFESPRHGSWIEFKKPGVIPHMNISYTNINSEYCKKVF